MPRVVEVTGVQVVREGSPILDGIDWVTQRGEKWVVLGPNGAGKTTLLDLIAARLHPTAGTVTILGERLGRVDVFELRPRIGYAGSAAARLIPQSESVRDAVMTAAWGVAGRWREGYQPIDVARADRMLAVWRLTGLAERRYGTLSDGEKKRVQIARALMTDPELLLLDEPAASLDVGAREEFVALLGSFVELEVAPAVVMVTHHVEEIPPGFTHALVLAAGHVVAAGPVGETLTSSVLTHAFGVPLEVRHDGGRFSARAA